jgi:hypothetical protein
MDPADTMAPVAIHENHELYWKVLVDCGYDDQDDPLAARFGRLSRLNITYLFNELIKIKAEIRLKGDTNKDQMDLLGKRLHQYSEWAKLKVEPRRRYLESDLLITNGVANALKDYQYMDQLPSLPSSLAFRQRTELERVFESMIQPNTTGINPSDKSVPYDNHYLSLNPRPSQKADPVRELLRKVLPKYISWTAQEKKNRRADYSRGEPPEIYSPSLNRIARFLVGLVGAAWLIVPLLIMAFHSSLTKTMITVCTSVVLFALAVSLVFELDNKDTVTATSTYAAVLVVFVGTSTTGS